MDKSVSDDDLPLVLVYKLALPKDPGDSPADHRLQMPLDTPMLPPTIEDNTWTSKLDRCNRAYRSGLNTDTSDYVADISQELLMGVPKTHMVQRAYYHRTDLPRKAEHS